MTPRPPAFLLLLGFCAAALAADGPGDVALERARIAAERSRTEAVFQAEQKACYGKFSVSGCIDEARARRSSQLGDLRRQEISLNDAERKARAVERTRQLEQKQADDARKQSEAAAKAAEKSAARERRAADKAAAAEERAAKAAGRTAPKEPATGETAGAAPKATNPATPRPPVEKQPDVEANRRRYEQRVQDAQAHQASVERRAAEQQKKNKPVQPLPDPP